MNKKQALIVTLTLAVGILGGLGLFTFRHAKGDSYFSNDPEACINCHVMREQYDSWNHSSHQNVATCNDCHTPHDTVGKYTTKAINGWNHSLAFTLGNYPENIQIREFNAEIVRSNCIECHSNVVSQMVTDPAHAETLDCVACHGNVGH
ncbi:MAG: cytochrome c nitrite reductase small subunit [Anaerolineae bacterium]|nr:cytochrome c nitrite reductase small subunit [Anaerolineae bacterium]